MEAPEGGQAALEARAQAPLGGLDACVRLPSKPGGGELKMTQSSKKNKVLLISCSFQAVTTRGRHLRGGRRHPRPGH